ncbi:Serine proteinase inhibitor IA-1 [Psilocybe cubensis]|uniref:Inhibitor I9 domain-containing protein n=2 Tax=Psilocybe cubensis TaxID=181762 RepID=A0A8H8CIM0_PSICU|nr:Serine proteinase inhibitor IA-1 [Psilocybe cubensis]KAH9479834.1 Serine proteinase inhibitor IA-1 [Psilocybe cubensis]
MSGAPYIVVFKDDVTKEQIDQYVKEVQQAGGELKTRFDEDGGILNGFAAKIPDSYLQSLQSFTDVISYIEPDGVVTTQ